MKKLKEYAFWNDDSNDEDGHYFEHYDEKEEAVREAGPEREVYEVNYKPLGFFNLKTSVVKAKRPKKRD